MSAGGSPEEGNGHGDRIAALSSVSGDLAGRLAGFTGRLDAFSQALGGESVDAARLHDLTRQLTKDAETFSGSDEALARLLAEARLSSLATRVAVHFFVEKSMPRFCEKVLDALIAEVGARSGALFLFNEESPKARVIAARDADGNTVPCQQLRVSRTILGKILDGYDTVLIKDAMSDELYASEDSVQKLPVRSVLAIPLRIQSYLAGAIHLENELSAGAFGQDDLQVLLGVGRLVAIYLDAAFRLGEERAARQRIYDELKGKTSFDGLVGNAPAFLRVVETIRQVGPTDATVLLEGENGTGKELVARALHLTNRRGGRPMVVVNCAAIPEQLLESELFGHEKGAYTHAFDRRIGRLEEADGSTLFLDEIGELSPATQAKLLRFLQDREVQRLGGARSRKVDVRVIAATNRDLVEMIRQKEFREDLFYRLYVVPIRIPPLRERASDVPLLVDHFFRMFAIQAGREDLEMDPEVYEIFQAYAWPGNVRELENLVQRLVVLCRSERIRVTDLPGHVRRDAETVVSIEKNPFQKFVDSTPLTYAELQRRCQQMHHVASEYGQKLQAQFVDAILERFGGNISRAAKETGIHRTVIHRNLAGRGSRRPA